MVPAGRLRYDAQACVDEVGVIGICSAFVRHLFGICLAFV